MRKSLMMTALVLAACIAVPSHASIKRDGVYADKTGSNSKAKRHAKVKVKYKHGTKMVLQAGRPRVVHTLAGASLLANNGELRLESSAALVINEEDGTSLYAKNAGAMVPIASITKLMTAMVVLDAQLPMDEAITIGYEDVDTLRNSHSRLAVGSVLTRTEMLRLALMSSENRAASALSRAYPGGTPAFVAAMNRKAQSIGMLHSQFVDSTGLNSSNVSTAQDLALMVKAGTSYDLIREYTTTANYQVDIPGARQSLAFRNTNALVKDKQWEIGLSKTGFIKEAGRCLVMQVKIGSKPFIIVLLDSLGKYSRLGDAKRIKLWVERTHNARVVERARTLQPV